MSPRWLGLVPAPLRVPIAAGAKPRRYLDEATCHDSLPTHPDGTGPMGFIFERGPAWFRVLVHRNRRGWTSVTWKRQRRRGRYVPARARL